MAGFFDAGVGEAEGGWERVKRVTCRNTREKVQRVMAKPSPYEYGLLQHNGSDYEFIYNGSQAGDKFEWTLYDAFNRLAQSGWEPHMFFTEPDGHEGTPTWIMRRTEA